MKDEENITIRDLMESMREKFNASIVESTALRGDVHALRDAVESLTVAIRGNGHGDKGLIRHMDSIQESQKTIVTKMGQFEEKGTPFSQKELIILREKNASQDVAITRVEEKMKSFEDKAESRRWQMIVLFISSGIAIIGMVVNFLKK